MGKFFQSNPRQAVAQKTIKPLRGEGQDQPLRTLQNSGSARPRGALLHMEAGKNDSAIQWMARSAPTSTGGNPKTGEGGSPPSAVWMHRVLENIEACSGTHLITLGGTMVHEPGQFLMVWLPGIGEKPFVPIEVEGKIILCIRKRGFFTEKICEVKKGGLVGIRGPLGKGFTFKGVKAALLVGGGLGVVPLLRLAKELKKQGAKIDVIAGAKCISESLLGKEFERNGNFYIITDDGSSGKKGYATDLLVEMASKKKYDRIYVCGPEIMMKKALDFCIEKKLDSEFSLERYMKCGIGICGQCAIDGLLVCRDGPVFKADELAKSKEFGLFAYDKAGKKVNLKEFYGGK